MQDSTAIAPPAETTVSYVVLLTMHGDSHPFYVGCDEVEAKVYASRIAQDVTGYCGEILDRLGKPADEAICTYVYRCAGWNLSIIAKFDVDRDQFEPGFVEIGGEAAQ